jgi:hypothetical protein
MKHKKLKGATIALVAMGRSQLNFAISLAHSEEYDEVWTINATAGIYKTDRMFMMDPPSRFLDDDVAGTQTGVVSKVITQKQEFPIYSCTEDTRCPSVEKYPISEVIKDTGLCYFNNTAAYALAYAVYQEVKEVHIFGVDFSYASQIHYAEAGRACCEFWCGILTSKGVTLSVAPESGFMDTNVPPEQKLYGYHRLDDPPHVSFDEGMLKIVPLSEVTNPPEPKDGVGLLYRG